MEKHEFKSSVSNKYRKLCLFLHLHTSKPLSDITEYGVTHIFIYCYLLNAPEKEI